MLVAMRVLVAEDHEVLATAIAAGLRREGMAVDLALRGHDALDRLSGTRYDVVTDETPLDKMAASFHAKVLHDQRNPFVILNEPGPGIAVEFRDWKKEMSI